jgi:hypothetical protein
MKRMSLAGMLLAPALVGGSAKEDRRNRNHANI